MISIITPAYNASQFISNTIESVIAQTYKDWEMLIVDDCSSDNTMEIVQDYAKRDTRIRLIQNAENTGAAEARNVALRQAKGHYIAFLDSDDMWKPGKLEKQLSFMQGNDYAFTFTGYECVNEKADKVLYNVNAKEAFSYRKFLRNTAIGTLTVMINRDKTGFFEMPRIRSSHDMALWLDIMKRGYKAYGLNECLAQYRLVEGSNTAGKLKAAKDVWRVYRDIEKLNLMYSCFNFTGYAVNAILKRMK
ncbi:MAG: glycosyltransferase family 2 protein [Candidatus Delongbacteria bacterium]|jgi:teichuronic acid biosynthesis glycosyltransferase TuaG|nr:glycosyltransferase family 2 protein [Candidatus Delongbacteria bacterium]